MVDRKCNKMYEITFNFLLHFRSTLHDNLWADAAASRASLHQMHIKSGNIIQSYPTHIKWRHQLNLVSVSCTIVVAVVSGTARLWQFFFPFPPLCFFIKSFAGYVNVATGAPRVIKLAYVHKHDDTMVMYGNNKCVVFSWFSMKQLQ